MSKFIFLVGCITAAFAFYAASFYIIRDNVVWAFERKNIGDTHKIRPAYNLIYYPMRYFVANGSSFRRDIPGVYRGTLKPPLVPEGEEKNHRSAAIDVFEGNWTSIGFVGRPDVLDTFDEIEEGTFIKITFGRALAKKYDGFINRLIDVEVIDLMPDPRIEKSDYTSAETDKIMADYKGLLDVPKNCVKPFVESYQDKVLLHCQQTGYAQNIGGGCYHIVGYSLHTAVFEQAVKTCSK